MTGYRIANLELIIDEIGEDKTRKFLSDFSCPMNEDVENFLKYKAIDFSKQGWSRTHLVFASYRELPILVGYFTLANKYIHISKKGLNSNWRRRLSAFSNYDNGLNAYVLAAPLIAQLGKNYANGYNKQITGDELLKMACDKVSFIQMNIGGRITYLECEDKPKLREFYESNGFYCFGQRQLDADETSTIHGECLLQYFRYIK